LARGRQDQQSGQQQPQQAEREGDAAEQAGGVDHRAAAQAVQHAGLQLHACHAGGVGRHRGGEGGAKARRGHADEDRAVGDQLGRYFAAEDLRERHLGKSRGRAREGDQQGLGVAARHVRGAGRLGGAVDDGHQVGRQVGT
jgi:hypothetical protein